VSTDEVIRAFNKCAAQYKLLASVQQRIAAQFFSFVQTKKTKSGVLLDIGCGTGFLTQKIKAAYPSHTLIALDAAPDMLACLPRLDRMQLMCADFDAIPLADNTCDAVFSSVALQWSQDVEKTLTEWLRVLKPGGQLSFSTLLVGTLIEWDACWEVVGDLRRVNRLLTEKELHALCLPVNSQWIASQVSHLTEYHLTSADALASVRDIGAGSRIRPSRKQGLMGQKKWQAFLSAYENRRTTEGLPLSYEVFYGTIQKK
jgi:malonyl-CoA O-methyltransferase